jgi:hypothetical protein
MSQEPMTTPNPGVAELPVARPDGCPFDPPSELAGSGGSRGEIACHATSVNAPRRTTPPSSSTIHRHPQDTP